VLTLTVDPALATGAYTVSVEATDGLSTYTESLNLTLLDSSAGAGLSFTKTTIAAGGSDQYGHTLAVTAASAWSSAITGQVLSWGSNGFGELGNNDFGNDSDVPVTVLGPDGSSPLEGIVSVAAGRTHGLALRGDGTVWAWGYASHGQLGGEQGVGAGFTGVAPDGSPIGYVPFAVPTCGPTDVISIAAGDSHSLALDASGDMWSWGNNQWGALGDGTTDHRWTPGPVLDPSGASHLYDVAVIGAGHFHSLAALTNGDLFAWGKNEYGALGNLNQPFDESLPVAVVNAAGSQITDIVDVDGGYQHSIAMDSAGQVYVWGDNYWGQLADDTMDKTLPHDQQTQDFASVLTGPTEGILPNQDIDDYPAVDVDAGADHSLVVTETDMPSYVGCHSVFAFGWGALGQNGNGLAFERDYVPVEVSTTTLGMSQISAVSAMGSHSVALVDWQPYAWCGAGTDGVGNVRTWGDNRVGQLGVGAGSLGPPCTLGAGTAACERSPEGVTAANFMIMLPNP
jgi:alpha-tubulin suppressor-like RCC1 family protein